MNLPLYDCPSYLRCAVNNCPLHPDYPDLSTCPEDRERTCKAQKPTRLMIAAKYPGILRYDGLTKSEYGRKQAWESKSPEEREKIRLRLKKMAFCPALKKEGTVVDSSIPGEREVEARR